MVGYAMKPLANPTKPLAHRVGEAMHYKHTMKVCSAFKGGLTR